MGEHTAAGRLDPGPVVFRGRGGPACAREPAADRRLPDRQPHIFRTLDLPVVSGRVFTDRDRRDSVPVCIVNEAFVRGPLHGRSPIGVRVSIRESPSPAAPSVVREIVGVARQVKGRPDEAEDLLQIYVPLAQDPMDDMFLVVRPESGRAGALAPSIRWAIAASTRTRQSASGM